MLQCKKVHSYIERYPVLGTVQSALHFTPLADLFMGLHSNAILTSLGSIQSCCNFCIEDYTICSAFTANEIMLVQSAC